MPFEFPVLPITADSNGVPFIAIEDESGQLALPLAHVVKKGQLWVLADANNPLPIVQAGRLEFLSANHDSIDVARISKGPISVPPVFDAVTSGGTSQEVYCGGYNAVLLHHVITGATTGGYATITMSPKSLGTFVPHHGKGQNIKTDAQASSYVSLFEGIFDYIKVVLSVTDGAHTIILQPINL